MEVELKKDYTLFVSAKLSQDQIAGVYLKKEMGCLYPVEMPDHEMEVIQCFPNIFEQIKKGKTLQLYQKSATVYASIGSIIGEGPYGEIKCFEMDHQTQQDNCFLALTRLEQAMNQDDRQTKQLRKAYKNEWKCYYE